MSCCACNGSCCHVGPHSYCFSHGGTAAYNPVIAAPNTTPMAFGYSCALCGTWVTNFASHFPCKTLSEEDIDKIAQRVIELLDERKAAKKAARK